MQIAIDGIINVIAKEAYHAVTSRPARPDQLPGWIGPSVLRYD